MEKMELWDGGRYFHQIMTKFLLNFNERLNWFWKFNFLYNHQQKRPVRRIVNWKQTKHMQGGVCILTCHRGFPSSSSFRFGLFYNKECCSNCHSIFCVSKITIAKKLNSHVKESCWCSTENANSKNYVRFWKYFEFPSIWAQSQICSSNTLEMRADQRQVPLFLITGTFIGVLFFKWL